MVLQNCNTFSNIRKLKLVHHYYLLLIQVSPFVLRMSFIGKDSVQNHALRIIVSTLLQSETIPPSILDFCDLDTFEDYRPGIL